MTVQAADSTKGSDAALVQPTPRNEIAPVYPYELLLAGGSGWVDARFVVDHRGRPFFASYEGASSPALVKAALAMVEATEFTPARKNKHAVMAPVVQRLVFPGEQALDSDAKRILSELRKESPGFMTLADLDQKPRAVKQDVPVYPRALRDDGLTGQAEIEFIVDETGRVHFPRIVSATQEGFGWAAATAISQWRYEAPVKNGKPVAVRMTVPVLFDARRLAASD